MSKKRPITGAAVFLAALHKGEHSDAKLMKVVCLGEFHPICSLLVDQGLIQRDASQQIWMLTDSGRSSVEEWLAS